MPDIEITKEAKINRDYKPTDKEQDLRKWVYKRKKDMEESEERKRAEGIWNDAEKAWDQHREENVDEWQSDYIVPITTSTVESVLSEMSEQMSRIMVMPRGQEDTPRAKVMNAIHEYDHEVSDGDLNMLDTMRGQVIHGTTVVQEYYLQDKRKISKILGLGDGKNERKQRFFETKEEEVMEYDGNYMEWVNPHMFLIDEKACEINRGTFKARDCIRRYIMNYRDAEEMFKHDQMYDHLNNFRFVKPGGDTDYYQFYKPPQGIDHSEEVEVLWYWSRTPDDLLVIVMNDVVVRMGPNPYNHKQLPFAKAVDVKRLGKFYGKGEPELLESIQEEADTMRRMIIDRNHLDIDKMFVVPQSATFNEEDLIARPHGMIPSDDPTNVRPVEYNDIPLSVQTTLKYINDDKISLTGIDDRFQSVQRTPSTATEAAILKESTLRRIGMKLKNIEKDLLVDVGRMRTSNIIQFYSQPKLEKIVGDVKSEEIKQEIGKLMREDKLMVDGKDLYKKSYRNIVMEGKEFIFDERGQVQERRKPGFSFFEAKPEYFVPVNERGYNIKIVPGPSLPVSKPLLQSKMTEMFQMLAPFAAAGQLGKYDLEKLADMVVDAHEVDPQTLKLEENVEDQNIEENRLALAIDLASQENQLVSKGEAIPPLGTPYAPPPHTEMHIMFIKSEVGKGLDEQNYQMLVKHVMGEMMAQQQRQQNGGGEGQPMQPGQQNMMPATAGGVNQGNQNMMPAKIEGGNQVPTGRALGNG